MKTLLMKKLPIEIAEIIYNIIINNYIRNHLFSIMFHANTLLNSYNFRITDYRDYWRRCYIYNITFDNDLYDMLLTIFNKYYKFKNIKSLIIDNDLILYFEKLINNVIEINILLKNSSSIISYNSASQKYKKLIEKRFNYIISLFNL